MNRFRGKDIRDVYAQTLIELAQQDERICVLEADLMNATGTRPFLKTFPERTFDVGVSEADMVGIAAGLSAEGMIPFAASFATFASRRAYDQFFLSGNYAKLNVKLVGTDPGVTATYNGGTHMPFEDVGMMRLIPDLFIVEPCDAVSCAALVKKIAAHQGSTYLRLHRKGAAEIYNETTEFTLGKGKVLKDGSDVTLVASGVIMVAQALEAARKLKKQGVSAVVLDIHTIKPLDTDLILSYAETTGAVVTCENHQITGGLGGAVAELLSTTRPTLMGRIGCRDRFGQVGTLDFLLKDYKMTSDDIVKETLRVLKQKQ